MHGLPLGVHRLLAHHLWGPLCDYPNRLNPHHMPQGFTWHFISPPLQMAELAPQSVHELLSAAIKASDSFRAMLKAGELNH